MIPHGMCNFESYLSCCALECVVRQGRQWFPLVRSGIEKLPDADYQILKNGC